MKRLNNRYENQLRPVCITRNYIKNAEGSVLVEVGETKVICTVSSENTVPRFLRGQRRGWLTAEYGMLPRATNIRNQRESSRGKQSGRSLEIQRLIGRSLRASLDLFKMEGITLHVDCDVIQADGGTRTASITGAMVALVDALALLKKNKIIQENPIKFLIAAVSVGIYEGRAILDLDYSEDSLADTDCNIIMTDSGDFIEIQGGAEKNPFREDELFTMLALSRKGIKEIVSIQKLSLLNS